MKVSIRSGSAAVKRTLEDLVRVAGHEVGNDQPALVVQDQVHPGAAAPAGDMPLLALTEPVRPAQLARQLQLALVAQPLVPLANGWKLDGATRQLKNPDVAPVALTEKECLLLAALARAYPQAAERDALLRDVWAYDGEVETHTLETHVYRLRAKLSGLHPKPCDIVTTDASYRLLKE